MVGTKRNSDGTSEEIESISRKCQRVSSGSTTTAAAASSTTTASCQDGPSLTTLPTEIIQRIFHESREPALIHTCRKLYHALPDYVMYVRSLALLAFGHKAYSWDQFAIPDVTLPLPELRTFVDLNRRELQIELSRSLWLTPALLQEARITIFEHVANATLLAPGMPLSPEERHEHEQRLIGIRQAFSFQHSGSAYMAARSCPENPYDGVSIRIEGDVLGIATGRSDRITNIFEMYAMPDRVVAHPTEPISAELITGLDFSAHYGTLSASAHLMQQAILYVLRAPKQQEQIHPTDDFDPTNDDEIVSRLLIINQSCDQPAPLLLEMMKTAVEMDKHGILRRLLCTLPNDALEYAFPESLSVPSDWERTIDDIIRLELSRQPHQLACYDLLALAIKACSYPAGLQMDVAQRLGFESLEALKAARDAVMHKYYGEGPVEYEEFDFDEYDGDGVSEDDEELDWSEESEDDADAEGGVYTDIGEGPRVVEVEYKEGKNAREWRKRRRSLGYWMCPESASRFSGQEEFIVICAICGPPSCSCRECAVLSVCINIGTQPTGRVPGTYTFAI